MSELSSVKIDTKLKDRAKRHAIDTGETLFQVIERAVTKLLEEEEGKAKKPINNS